MFNEAAVEIHNVEGKDAALVVSCAQLSKVILAKSVDSSFRVESYYESFSNSNVDDVFWELNLLGNGAKTFSPDIEATIV